MPSLTAHHRISGDGSSLTLPDGTAVRFRPMGDDDGERLVRFHATLSPETQYLRFFSGHARLNEHEVEWFTHVDHRNRDAFVAEHEGEIVGVGRLDALAAGTDAEVAFVVTDRLHGLGLGSALLRRVIDRAVDLGFEHLVADTLWHNNRMLRVFRRSGLPTTTRMSDGVIHVTMTLPPPR